MFSKKDKNKKKDQPLEKNEQGHIQQIDKRIEAEIQIHKMPDMFYKRKIRARKSRTSLILIIILIILMLSVIGLSYFVFVLKKEINISNLVSKVDSFIVSLSGDKEEKDKNKLINEKDIKEESKDLGENDPKEQNTQTEDEKIEFENEGELLEDLLIVQKNNESDASWISELKVAMANVPIFEEMSDAQFYIKASSSENEIIELLDRDGNFIAKVITQDNEYWDDDLIYLYENYLEDLGDEVNSLDDEIASSTSDIASSTMDDLISSTTDEFTSGSLDLSTTTDLQATSTVEDNNTVSSTEDSLEEITSSSQEENNTISTEDESLAEDYYQKRKAECESQGKDIQTIICNAPGCVPDYICIEKSVDHHPSSSSSSEDALLEDIDSEKYSPSFDNDQDGLLNIEEETLGTDLNNEDSDEDTYKDRSELLNLYDPAGKGKLISNENISKYENHKFNYSIYYPNEWSQVVVGGDNIIIFKASETHFVQVLVEEKGDYKDIEDWYLHQDFDEEVIEEDRKFFVKDVSGVRSKDGLNVYLWGEDHVFVIFYTIGTEDVELYKNIFEMMVNSFRAL